MSGTKMSNMKMWKTANGEKIRIRDMSDKHILNTINYLERCAEKEQSRYLRSLESLSFMFGDSEGMAGFAVDQEIDSFCEDQDGLYSFLPDIYFDLVEEANKRRISNE